MSTFIAHTPLAHMRALGSVAERSHSRIASILSRHFSDEYAALLAEPVPNPDGSGIDWFVDADAQVQRLADLPEDEADAIREKLDEMTGHIRAEIERIEDGGGGAPNRQAQTLANALRNAITIPGEDYIWAVQTPEGDYQPLLIGWGYMSHESTVKGPFDVTARGQVLQGARARQAPPPPQAGMNPVGPAATATESAAATNTTAAAVHSLPAVHVVERGGFWQRWLVPLLLAAAFLLMLALLVSYLLPACGLRTPFGTIVFGWLDRGACVQNVAQGPDNLGLQTIALQRELDVLRENFERRRRECTPPPTEQAVLPEPEEVVPPEPEPEDFSIEERGKAQVTLEWATVDDLDLAVVCPRGFVIKHNSRQGCGGNLDIDANANLSKMRDPPGENITFEQGLSEPGPYRIQVTHYNSRTRRYPVKFRVRIRDGNGQTRVVEGQLDREKQVVQVGEMRQ
ncbi:hypothetical protein [uncultured Roseibium sp.]|uniref:hypothetical protein n=1 Tax=uncultured Roseibium sp. TaxID=1936171 RepID=UPI003217A7C3